MDSRAPVYGQTSAASPVRHPGTPLRVPTATMRSATVR